MSLQYTLVGNPDGTGTITVYVDGIPKVADHTHTNYQAICDGALAGDESIVDLFDVVSQIEEKFSGLSERVSIYSGHVYFDNDLVDSSLTDQLIRLLDEGDEVQWISLVNFYEKIQQNPNEHSREQLYNWIRKYPSFTITLEGNLIGYKGVSSELYSTFGGKAIVDGKPIHGRIPYQVGSLVEMPRSEVTHDPAIGCSQGL